MKVLLADEFDQRADALIRHLHAAGIGQVERVVRSERLFEAVKRYAPDIIIVDMSRADRDSLEPIREVAAREPKPIIMFHDSDDPGFMEDAIDAGVSSYNVRGTSLPAVKPIVQVAVVIFRKFQKFASELRLAETRLQDVVTVQTAKRVLMEERKISESEAHNWLRARAMRRRKRIPEIAREFLGSKGVSQPVGDLDEL